MNNQLAAVNNNSLDHAQVIPPAMDALRVLIADFFDNSVLAIETGSKDHRSRVNLYIEWLDTMGLHWSQPALAEYAQHMSKTYSPSSIQAHLSTIRSRYRELLDDPHTQENLRQLADRAFPSYGVGDKLGWIQVFERTIEAGLNPRLTRQVKVTKVQDTVDSDHTRLTEAQAESFLTAPGLKTLRGLRDSAMIALMLCTGLREAEICNLTVNDLRQKSGGELGLLVRKGKGAKQRFVPYGELSWCLTYVDAWLAQAGITEGFVFRSFIGKQAPNVGVGEWTPAETADKLTENMTTRTLQKIIKQYSVIIDGAEQKVTPHDLRRTYANLLYRNGRDIISIRDNLGHADIKTTQTYIGSMDMSKRRAPAVIRPQRSDIATLTRLGSIS